MKRYRVMLMFVCTMLSAAGASAQEKGSIGLVMGFPTSLAAIWHATAAVAIRPELSLSRSSNSTTTLATGAINASSGQTTSIGASVLLYGAKKDNVCLFVSPRLVYNRNSLTTTTTPPGTSVSTTVSSMTYGGGAGAQYSLNRRFSAYGEVGLTLTHSSQTTTIATTKNNVFGIRSAIGGILYF